MGASSDDAEQAVTGGSVQLSSGDLELDHRRHQPAGRRPAVRGPAGPPGCDDHQRLRPVPHRRDQPGCLEPDDPGRGRRQRTHLHHRRQQHLQPRHHDRQRGLDATGLDGGRRGRHRPAHPEPRIGACRPWSAGPAGPRATRWRCSSAAPAAVPPRRSRAAPASHRSSTSSTPPVPVGRATSRRWSTPVRTRRSPCPPRRPWTAPSPTTACPPPGSLTSTWSRVSGPGTVTFANASAADTTATFSAPGTYVLRLTATDGALTAQDEVTVTVNPATPGNTPPVVNAGPDQTDHPARHARRWTAPSPTTASRHRAR